MELQWGKMKINVSGESSLLGKTQTKNNQISI